MLLNLLPKVLYNRNNKEFHLNVSTKPMFMNSKCYDYVFTYVSDDDVYAVEIRSDSLTRLLWLALKWTYSKSTMDWYSKSKFKDGLSMKVQVIDSVAPIDDKVAKLVYIVRITISKESKEKTYDYGVYEDHKLADFIKEAIEDGAIIPPITD